MIQENHQIKHKDITLKLGICKERVGHIISLVGFSTVCNQRVWRKLTDDMQAERVRVARQHLGCCENEGEVFLWRIGTDDESRAHPYDPENKIQSMGYCCKASPLPKKFKTKCPDAKVMWLYSGTLMMLCSVTSWKKGVTMNSEHYTEILKNLKTHTTKEAEFLSWLSVGRPTDSQLKKQNTYQLLYMYSIPPDDGQQICPKHVEVDWQNKLRINGASSWFLLHR